MPDTISLDPQTDDQQLLAQVIDHYHATLKEDSEGRDYLFRRGITNPEAIDHFRIGFADYSLADRLPASHLDAGKAIRARLQGMGILTSPAHQRFRGCLVFPVTAADGSGRVVDLYGHRISRNPGSPLHRHLSEVRQGVWNVEALAGNEEIILCPSLFDALTFWNAGYRNVTCTFGPDALTDDHLAAFARLGVRRVLLMAHATAPRLLDAKIECHWLPFPLGVSANQYALKGQARSQRLEGIIAKAVRLETGACPASPTPPETTREPSEAGVKASRPTMKRTRPASAKAPRGPSATEPLPLCVDDDQKLLAQVIDYYHRTLKESTEGLNYLRKRGLTVGEAIDRFRVGYSNRTLGLRLPLMALKTGRQIRTRLQQLGIYRGTGRENYCGCVTFPITAADGSGRVMDIYGRKTHDDLRKGTLFHVHLSEQPRGVWNIEAFRAGHEIILCPGLWDALTFWNHGYRNVTCTFGPDALTDDHLAALREFEIRRVLTVSASVAPKLLAAGIDCYHVRLPPDLDINVYALEADDPPKALGTLLRRAEWLGKGHPPAQAMVPAAAVPQPTAESGGEMPKLASSPETQLTDPDLEDDLNQFDDDEDDLDDGELEELEGEPDAFDDDNHDGESDERPTLAAPTPSFLLRDRASDGELPDEGRPDAASPPADASPPAKPPLSAPILTASPLPPAPDEIEADVDGDEVTMQLGHRRYRIRGLSRNLAFDLMKVNILVTTDNGMFVDTFDLYVARHRRQFTAQAAIELGVEEQTIKKDLGRVLLKLEELQDQQITKMIEVKEPPPTMTGEQRQEALELLRDPKLLERIVADFDVVGETTNKLVGYLAAVSRKLDQPLAIIVQSSSAAGKTALMDSVLAFVPPEDQVKFSAMTGQSLYYMGERDLKHKILAIVEEEGAERASYALKLLQSEGALTIASTGKDSSTGRLVTEEYRVEGPVMIFLTTTAIKIDEELLNRCIVLTVDENREQTKAIHQFQRRRQTLAGLLTQQHRQDTLTLHRNAQRLLRPLLVANPFAERLTFVDDKTRTRRDHMKYLTLIRTIALLHQFQRPVKTAVDGEKQVEYIEVTLEDIAIANRLACEALGRSVDELPPQTRRLLGLVDEMVTAACKQTGIDRADCRFSRRDIREYTNWGHTQLKVHLKRLEELEYLLVHRGGRGQSFVYELLYDPPPDAQSKFLARLIDVEQLRQQHEADLSGSNGHKSGHGRGQAGVKSGRSRPRRIAASANGNGTTPPSDAEVDRSANLDPVTTQS